MEAINKQMIHTNEAILHEVIRANRNYNDGSGSSKEQLVRPKLSADLVMHKAFLTSLALSSDDLKDLHPVSNSRSSPLEQFAEIC